MSKWLALGKLLLRPLGVGLLASLSETPLRLLISALLMAAAITLRNSSRATLLPTRGLQFSTRLVSGFITGVAAIGGIALAALLSAAQMTPATLRTTLIALLPFSDLVSLACASLMPSTSLASSGLLGPDTLQWALWLAPAMLAGIWFGQRLSTMFRQHFSAAIC